MRMRGKLFSLGDKILVDLRQLFHQRQYLLNVLLDELLVPLEILDIESVVGELGLQLLANCAYFCLDCLL